MSKFVGLGWVAVLVGVGLVAQEAAHFDVVSIKAVTEWQPVIWSGAVDPTHFRVEGFSLSMIVANAYEMNAWAASRIEGLPDWASGAHYEITATMPAGTTRGRIGPMLQAMLADRFKMKTHWETRPMAAATLRVAPSGDKLTLDTVCGENDDDLPVKLVAPELIGKPAVKETAPPGCGSATGGDAPGETTYRGFTMARLAASIRLPGGLPVVDQTGLKGSYDFTFSDPVPGMSRAMDGTERAASGDDFEKAREEAYLKQLGLVLNPRNPEKLPMQILVVDHLERPSEN